MTPINTSHSKPVIAYPTPLLQDVEVITTHDARLADYRPLDYGTPYPDQVRFPGLKLIHQEPINGEDRTVRRIWAADRQNQDSYNADRKYSGGSTEHPILIRRYLFPEEDYTPLNTGTPDSQFPEAILVEEEVTQPENRNGYLAVTRVFETVPGPLLTGKLVTDKGQVATITTQVVAPGTTVTPSALTVSASVKPNSKGKSVLEKVEVAEVFPQKSFSVSNPDPVPEKFRIAVPAFTEEETEAGTSVSAPVLGVGEIEKRVEQLTAFTRRKRKTSRSKAALPKTLKQVATSDEQQKQYLDDTLQFGDTTRTPSVTVDVESNAQGDGSYVVRTTDEVEIFTGPSFSAEVEDSVPGKFRSQIATRTEERTEVGTARKPELKAGEISKSFQQIDKFKVRKRVVKRNAQLYPVHINQVDTNEVKQKVLVTETLRLGVPTDTEEPSATTTIQSEAVGPGTYVVRKVTAPEVFSEISKEVDRGADLLPERFRNAIPQETTVKIVEGEVSDSLQLSANETTKSEAQITKFTKRVRTSSRKTVDNPVVIRGQVYDEVLNKGTPYTERILVGEGAQFPATAEVTPLSNTHHVVREFDIAASKEELEKFHLVFPSQENVKLPDRLISAKAIFTRSRGDAQGWGYGSYTVRVESESAVSGELLLEIEQGFSGSAPAEIHVFFVAAESGQNIPELIRSRTGATPWPIIILRNRNVILHGQVLKKEFTRSVSPGSGSVGTSTDVKPITSVYTIPPVINTRIPISIEYRQLQAIHDPLDAYLDKLIGQLSSFPGAADLISILSDLPDLDGKVDPPTIDATEAQIFPSGRYIYSSDVTLYKYGLVKVTAVVVNTSGLTEGSGGVPTVAPTITSPLAVSGNVGQPFSYQITATDRPTHFYASGVPTPLVFSNTTGRITGTPTLSTAGVRTIRIQAQNAVGVSPVKNLVLTIN